MLISIIRARRGDWPTTMRLRGFAYDKLENDATSVTDRLVWLGSSEGGYIPGLYDQLAGAYRRAGRIEAPRRIGVAKELSRRTELTWPGKVWNSLLYATVGYGYRNWLAAVWLGAPAAGMDPAGASPRMLLAPHRHWLDPDYRRRGRTDQRPQARLAEARNHPWQGRGSAKSFLMAAE